MERIVAVAEKMTLSTVCFGSTRSGSVPTDIQFTGQRLDDTGLYYYGARYYDSSIGRFISPDPTIPDSTKPQAFNRYSYVLNSHLKYVDPTGLWWEVNDVCETVWQYDDGTQIPEWEYYSRQAALRESQQITVMDIHDPPLDPEWEKIVVQDTPTAAEIITEIVFDTLGQINSLPNTLVGLGLAALSGGDARIGPGGTVIVENIDTDSLTGKFMTNVLNGAPAFTVGYVVLTTEPSIKGSVTELHELGHVTQAAITGKAYLPLYGVSAFVGWVASGFKNPWDKNPMEVGRGHPMNFPRR